MTSLEPGRAGADPEKPQTAIAILLDAMDGAERARQTIARALPELCAARDRSTGQPKRLAIAVITQATIGAKRLEEAAARLGAAKTLHRSTASARMAEGAEGEPGPGDAYAPDPGGRVTVAH